MHTAPLLQSIPVQACLTCRHLRAAGPSSCTSSAELVTVSCLLPSAAATTFCRVTCIQQWEALAIAPSKTYLRALSKSAAGSPAGDTSRQHEIVHSSSCRHVCITARTWLTWNALLASKLNPSWAATKPRSPPTMSGGMHSVDPFAGQTQAPACTAPSWALQGGLCPQGCTSHGVWCTPRSSTSLVCFLAQAGLLQTKLQPAVSYLNLLREGAGQTAAGCAVEHSPCCAV